MKKSKNSYVCNDCGGISPKWQGQCPHCQAWNSLSESLTPPQTATLNSVQTLASIATLDIARIPTGSYELDRVLGGGLAIGSVVLIGGDPGIGKSTLLLQVLGHISRSQSTLYVSGEESASQIALRAKRLNVSEQAINLLSEIHLESILAALAQQQPAVVVIDSIQTLFSEALPSAAGSVAQVRECAAQLTRFAKQQGATIFLVGHVTKEGAIAGPRVLEHMVDAVLYFEGDSHANYRLIRANKNRFGAANELGVFAMTEKGLRSVANPSALFLTPHPQAAIGSCVLVSQEGTRPLLIEIQALVNPAYPGAPKRLSVGLEQNRLAMLLAVLQRHIGLACADQDVFVNAVGGMHIHEPAADLAILLAIISSMRHQALPAKLAVFGEIGLSGEIRPVQRGQERLKEARKLGFAQAIIPAANHPKQALEGLIIIPTAHLSDIKQALQQLETAETPNAAQKG